MILPKSNVFVVYGHKPHLLDATINTIKEAGAEGFRVREAKLDDDQLSKSKSMSVYEELRNLIDRTDAAIVLLTADDVGAKGDEIGILATLPKKALEALRPRARQNVVLELGMLLNKVGDKNILILTDKSAEPPSDLVGRFWEFIDNPSDAVVRIRRFIAQISRKAPLYPLRDPNQLLDYSDIRFIGDMPIKTFHSEFMRLDNPEEKALYLAERLVFDSYIDNRQWWRDRLNEIENSDSSQLTATIEVLKCIMDYMYAWSPPDRKEFSEIALACKRLGSRLHRIEGDNVRLNPVVLIAAYDYLGLAYNKLAKASTSRDLTRKHLFASVSALDKCISMVDRYDDRALELWKGYALFNRARSFQELVEVAPPDDREKLRQRWREEAMAAIQIRRKWKDQSLEFPATIQTGLTTEFFHAVAVRIECADRDGLGRIDEGDGPFCINDEWVAEKGKEYKQWWDNPQGLRVRLAANVAENWKKIEALSGGAKSTGQITTA